MRLLIDGIYFCWSHQPTLFQLIKKIVFNSEIPVQKTTLPVILQRNLQKSGNHDKQITAKEYD